MKINLKVGVIACLFYYISVLLKLKQILFLLRFIPSVLLALIISTTFGSEGDIDKYNEETINLLDDLDSCLVRVDIAIRESENSGYEYGQAYALYLKGYIHRVQNDLGKAFLANLKALNVLQSVNDNRAPETLVRLCLNTGEILKKHFKYDEAVQYYSEGLEIAKRNNFQNWIIDLNYNAGYAYLTKGDLSLAADYIHEAYKAALKENDEHTIVNALNLMGLTFKNAQRYDTAILFFNKMLDFSYQELSADKYKGRSYHNLANTYAQAGDTARAINCFKKALEFKELRGKPSEIFITEHDLAELFYNSNHHSSAAELVKNCIENYDQIRLAPEHYKVFDLARKISSSLTDHSLASEYANRYFLENDRFIKQQEELIMIRDQFKMEILTASFFGELDRNKKISNLNLTLTLLSILSVIIIAYMKYRQIWVKNLVSKRLDQLIDDFDE